MKDNIVIFDGSETAGNIELGQKALLFLSAINCFYRADVTFPLCLFGIIILRKYEGQVVRLFYLYLITTFIDLIWILLWHQKHQMQEYQGIAKKEIQLFSASIILSSIILILKVIFIAFLAWKSPYVQHNLTPDGIAHSISNLFTVSDKESRDS